MITRWIERKGHERLLIFFNGWGMDSGIAGFLQSNTTAGFGHDILHCYDYRSTAMSADVLDAVAGYGERTLIAWSFGVWAASRAGLEGIGRALAVNGTLHPVSDEEGIPPEMFRVTLERYDEENRRRFMRRMCGGTDPFRQFLGIAPERGVDDQRAELAALLQNVLQNGKDEPPSWSFTHALIGGRDLIFSAAAQGFAWRGIKQKTVDGMPHFPFFEFSNWQELCTCMEE